MASQNQTANSLLEIIKKTSIEIPEDTHRALKETCEDEPPKSPGRYSFELILANIQLAKEKQIPIAPDSGSIIFYIDCPRKFDEDQFTKHIRLAVTWATKQGYLRQNSVDPITGAQTANNLGAGTPAVYYRQMYRKDIMVRALLVPGVLENAGAQYALPDWKIGADKDWEGIRKCIADAALRTSTLGCGPGSIGVGIGGDRATSYALAKEQLLRKLTDVNPIRILAKLEEEIVASVNAVGKGPFGAGGRTTLLSLKIGAYNHLRDSYFVSVAYMGWAFRRQGGILDPRGKIKKWLYS